MKEKWEGVWQCAEEEDGEQKKWRRKEKKNRGRPCRKP